jgi:hypothetical protein
MKNTFLPYLIYLIRIPLSIPSENFSGRFLRKLLVLPNLLKSKFFFCFIEFLTPVMSVFLLKQDIFFNKHKNKNKM